LSILISQAITFGNSILSELDSTSTTSSSTPTTSSSLSSSTSSSSSQTPTAAPSQAAAAAIPQPSSHHTNVGLIAGLAAGIGLIALLLLLGLLWFCLHRRRKSKATNAHTKRGRTDSWVASTEDNRSHLTAPDEGYDYNSNGYPQGLSVAGPVMAERAHPRPNHSGYESLSPVSTNSPPHHHANPFIAAHEVERPVPPFLAHHNISEPSSWESAESNPRPIVRERPSSPVEMHADVPKSSTTLVNGIHGGRHAGNVGEQGNGTSIWPSKTAANDFDFGIKRDHELAGDVGIPQPVRDGEFRVPRRPISGQPTAM